MIKEAQVQEMNGEPLPSHQIGDKHTRKQSGEIQLDRSD